MIPELEPLSAFCLANAYFEAALRDPSRVGLTSEDLSGKPEQQVRELVIGECLFRLSRAAGEAAYKNLFKAQWGYAETDWFDHRLHALGMEAEWNDFFAYSADNVISVLPLGSRLLSLCAGDAWYERWFFLRRASEIVCVDVNPACHRHYLRLHQAPGLTYHLADVLTYMPPAAHFDVVVCRGAIEHFTQAQQQRLFQTAWAALKPGGWFCGDTPASRGDGSKLLPAHDFEWRDEAQMRAEIGLVFPHVEAQTLVSTNRTTLFWRARKDAT